LNSNFTISIIDRKKNLVKPPHGEYIAIERLEAVYKNSPLVEHIMVIASSHHNPLLAFVQPRKASLESKFGDSWEKACKSNEMKKEVLESLAKIWKENGLKSIERISEVILFPEEWSPDNGFLTAAMKINRTEITKKHKDEIDETFEKLTE